METVYTAPVAVRTTSTLNAIGVKAGWTGSGVQGGAYTMHFGTLSAPAVLPATGTYTSDVSVTMSTTQTGAVIRYTTDGTTPTASSPIYTDAVAVTATGTTVTAMALHPDYTTSPATTHVYTLAAPTPAISPVSGTYTSAQTVTITGSGPGVTLRYTTDGSDPTGSSPEYGGAFAVATGTTVTARAFPANGWAPSAAASAVLSFDYGTLDPPVAAPAGGVYADAQVVTLTGPAGATIRYTTDGSEPTAVSNLYMTPVEVSAGAVAVKARAFHPDWTPSAVASAEYIIDVEAPTITASRLPAAVNTWHQTPTTVSFVCADNVGISSCSGPVTISQEGAGQQVTGTAVDQAGRQASVVATVNLDLTAPLVHLTAPLGPLTTGNATLEISGTVSDALSGIAAATCDGQAASVVAGVVTCVVTLYPGRNDVVLAARDAAGHTASASVRVLRIGTTTSVGLSPSAMTLRVGEATALSLQDEFGAAVAGASWTTSDSLIVSVSQDDPPVFTAEQAGTATITATTNGLTATATLTVMAGPSLPYGTTRWSLSGAPGFTVAQSLAANRVALDVPDLFSVEHAGAATIVRGVTAMGDVHWVAHAPGEPLMGDAFGGLVGGLAPWTHHPEHELQVSGYVRFAGPAGSGGWRYESRGTLTRPAQAADGTIYTVERYATGLSNPNGVPIIDTQVLVLDGQTGAVQARYPLARERRGLGCGGTASWEASPVTLGPVVGTDGHGYVAVRSWTNVRVGACTNPMVQDVGVTLLRVSSAGAVTPTSLYAQHCDKGPNAVTVCDQPPLLKELFPDGIGGTLVRAFYSTSAVSPSTYTGEMRVTRVAGSAVQFSTVVDVDERILMIGDGGRAYLGGDDVRAVDVTTWASIWTNSNLSLEPVMAIVDDRVAMHDVGTGILHVLDAIGVTMESGSFGGRWGYQAAFGVWTSVESGQIAARLSLPLNESRASFRFLGQVGTEQNAMQSRTGTDRDLVSLFLMDFMMPLTRASGAEYSGEVCGEPNGSRFYWHRVRAGTALSAGGPTLVPELCADGMITVGYAHTHPGNTAAAQLPSGYHTYEEYIDARPDLVGDQGSDLKLADDFHDGVPGVPHWGDQKHRNLTWYLVTTSPTQTTEYLRYKATGALASRRNIDRYNRGTKSWIHVGNPPW